MDGHTLGHAATHAAVNDLCWRGESWRRRQLSHVPPIAGPPQSRRMLLWAGMSRDRMVPRLLLHRMREVRVEAGRLPPHCWHAQVPVARLHAAAPVVVRALKERPRALHIRNCLIHVVARGRSDPHQQARPVCVLAPTRQSRPRPRPRPRRNTGPYCTMTTFLLSAHAASEMLTPPPRCSRKSSLCGDSLDRVTAPLPAGINPIICHNPPEPSRTRH
jgi:hypothetical protein